MLFHHSKAVCSDRVQGRVKERAKARSPYCLCRYGDPGCVRKWWCSSQLSGGENDLFKVQAALLDHQTHGLVLCCSNVRLVYLYFINNLLIFVCVLHMLLTVKDVYGSFDDKIPTLLLYLGCF